MGMTRKIAAIFVLACLGFRMGPRREGPEMMVFFIWRASCKVCQKWLIVGVPVVSLGAAGAWGEGFCGHFLGRICWPQFYLLEMGCPLGDRLLHVNWHKHVGTEVAPCEESFGWFVVACLL